MVAGGAPTGLRDIVPLAHLVDPSRKWYNNRRLVSYVAIVLPCAHSHVDRLIILHAWIVLLYVWKSPHITYDCSNIVALPSLITSSTNGYDGSMMNGLQSLSQWESAFGNPSGGKLGLLNAIQVSTQAHKNFMSTDHTYVEYRCIGSLSFCPLRVGRYWSPSGRVVWCDYNVDCDCRSNCCAIRRHVHWCPFFDRLWPHFRRQVQ